MARVCQLTDDLKYYICMEPVDMRKQFQGLQGIVNEELCMEENEVNDMFEQQQDTGKSASLEEEYAKVQAQFR